MCLNYTCTVGIPLAFATLGLKGVLFTRDVKWSESEIWEKILIESPCQINTPVAHLFLSLLEKNVSQRKRQRRPRRPQRNGRHTTYKRRKRRYQW